MIIHGSWSACRSQSIENQFLSRGLDPFVLRYPNEIIDKSLMISSVEGVSLMVSSISEKSLMTNSITGNSLVKLNITSKSLMKEEIKNYDS